MRLTILVPKQMTAPEQVDGKTLLARYATIDTLEKALIANTHSLAYGNTGLTLKFAYYLAGRGFPPVHLLELGHANFLAALKQSDDLEDLFIAAVCDPIVSARYANVYDITQYLFRDDVIDTGEFEIGDDGTTDFATYIAGFGITPTQLQTITDVGKLKPIFDKFEAAGSPDMLLAFIQGYVDSSKGDVK